MTIETPSDSGIVKQADEGYYILFFKGIPTREELKVHTTGIRNFICLFLHSPYWTTDDFFSFEKDSLNAFKKNPPLGIKHDNYAMVQLDCKASFEEAATILFEAGLRTHGKTWLAGAIAHSLIDHNTRIIEIQGVIA